MCAGDGEERVVESGRQNNGDHVQENPDRQSRGNRGARFARVPGARHPTVGVFSEADRTALHVRLADEAYPIGPAASRESYLRIDKLMDVARRAGCDALHPGYGFLAENPGLPRACKDAGITFIGPSAEAMEAMGSKTAGKQLARRAEVPTVPGTSEANENPEEVQALGAGHGLSRGAEGGGRRRWQRDAGGEQRRGVQRGVARCSIGGTQCVRRCAGVPGKISDCGRGMWRFKYLRMRMGAWFRWANANVPCRGRHQKVIEEAPSPVVTPDLRKKMGEAAVRLARAGVT